MKNRVATLALLAGLIVAPGVVASAQAGQHCARRHDGYADSRYDRYDAYDRYDGPDRYDHSDRGYAGYDDGDAYVRAEPRYRHAGARYDYVYAPRASISVFPFPPPLFSFFFSR